MAVSVTELFDSRERSTGSSASATLKYIVTGTSDDSVALANVATTAPSSYGGLVRMSRKVTPIGDPTISESWNVSVQYASPSRRTPEVTDYTQDDFSLSFDTSGGTAHITQSRSTLGAYDKDGTVSLLTTDHQGAIGDDGKRINGADITVPVYNFSETYTKDSGDVTLSYRGTLFALTGTINDAWFKGFNAGEVLFLGASGTRNADGDWKIVYKFSAKQNRTNVVIGRDGSPDAVTVASVGGWDLLNIRYYHKDTGEALSKYAIPEMVYVEKVYADGDFSGLDIGGTSS